MANHFKEIDLVINSNFDEKTKQRMITWVGEISPDPWKYLHMLSTDAGLDAGA